MSCNQIAGQYCNKNDGTMGFFFMVVWLRLPFSWDNIPYNWVVGS